MRDLKAKLREQFRGQIPLWPSNWDQKLLAWLQQQPPGVWGAYFPLKDEPPIVPSLIQVKQLNWAFPRLNGEALEFHRLSHRELNESESWKKGRFGLEPAEGALKVDPSELKALLIPALAYDIRGYRLGRGGGFYDRFLQNFSGVRVGVIHSSRILPEVPVEVFDQRVDWLVTEKSVSRIGE